jgi:DNA-binding NarL/FixJ family response regulator
MLKILVIDDRKAAREHVRELLETHLPEGSNVDVSDAFPLQDVEAYASHIREHDIAALILDERLGEVRDTETDQLTTYFGHEVISTLRAQLPDFPVYVVTTFKTDPDLSVKAADFEDIIDRDEFQINAQIYTNRIIRAAARFQDAMDSHLQTLTALTLKAAEGALTQEERENLEKTRTILGLPFTSSAEIVASDLLAQARAVALESEALVEKLKKGATRK